MPFDVRIPTLGESITEGVIVRWIKQDGDTVVVDEPLLELETDKASVEIPAERAGVLRILKAEGETVQVGEVVAHIEEGKGKAAETVPPVSATAPAKAAAEEAEEGRPAQPQAEPPPAPPSQVLSPAVRRLIEEHALDPQAIRSSGRGGRLTKADVLAYIDALPAEQAAAPAQPIPSAAEARQVSGVRTAGQRRVPLTRLRQRIAERLVEAQQTAAILTTFNEVDMSAVMQLRSRHKARFAEKHGASLGFMSFFARACVGALKEVAVVNARIDGSDVVYNDEVHLGIAVATERGLVVPVLHCADQMSFADIEKGIARLADLARQNKLGIDDLSGGTFSITNGGVFGSLLSTPILNPPQSAILGMHKIEKRPVVVDDAVVIRPMMYLAVSYDHRLIDGEQAVTFLVRVKERLEDPSRMLLEL
jgi:2-oxoglutarate dehydrogenase E2 component (dihydrolipoamide succinyltransferase)